MTFVIRKRTRRKVPDPAAVARRKKALAKLEAEVVAEASRRPAIEAIAREIIERGERPPSSKRAAGRSIARAIAAAYRRLAVVSETRRKAAETRRRAGDSTRDVVECLAAEVGPNAGAIRHEWLRRKLPACPTLSGIRYHLRKMPNAYFRK